MTSTTVQSAAMRAAEDIMETSFLLARLSTQTPKFRAAVNGAAKLIQSAIDEETAKLREETKELREALKGCMESGAFDYHGQHMIDARKDDEPCAICQAKVRAENALKQKGVQP